MEWVSKSYLDPAMLDVALLLAYALPFTAIMLIIEMLLVQPFERHVSRWRPRGLKRASRERPCWTTAGQGVELIADLSFALEEGGPAR